MTETQSPAETCKCPPCPGRGNDGHGMAHCAECCFNSGVVADLYCLVHGVLPERFTSKVRADESGCWLWTAGIASTGYGAFWVPALKQMVSAHRYAWEAMHGPVPPGRELDHLCRVRSCVNPAHLEPVTRRTNILRGDGPAATRRRQLAKTICAHGHPLSGDNLIVRPDGRRRCRTCKQASFRRWYRKQRADA